MQRRRSDRTAADREREFQVFGVDESEARTQVIQLALKTYDLERDEVSVVRTTRIPAVSTSGGWLVGVRLA